MPTKKSSNAIQKIICALVNCMSGPQPENIRESVKQSISQSNIQPGYSNFMKSITQKREELLYM
jgi:hypothetical protein